MLHKYTTYNVTLLTKVNTLNVTNECYKLVL